MPEPTGTSSSEHSHRVFRLLRDNAGSRVASELSALGLSARTFDGNALVLTNALKRFEHAIPNELLTAGRRHDLWEFAFDVVRGFQNTVASGQSFLEHSRGSVTRRYAGTAFSGEFKRHWTDNIKNLPVCAFARNLRNYLLHTESIKPTLTRSLVDFSDPFDAMATIQLDTAGMRAEPGRWDKDPIAREYLDSLRGSINIRRLICEYHRAVAAFGNWLLKRELELNAQALGEHDAIVDEAKMLVPTPYDEDLEAIRQQWKRESWFSSSDGHR